MTTTKSGTPWIVGEAHRHYLLGAHIGKTVAVKGGEAVVEVAYVKIFDILSTSKN